MPGTWGVALFLAGERHQHPNRISCRRSVQLIHIPLLSVRNVSEDQPIQYLHRNDTLEQFHNTHISDSRNKSRLRLHPVFQPLATAILVRHNLQSLRR